MSRADASSVLIIGGGLAGLAAATALADQGLRVTLIEKRPLLGGRAGSFIDPETGERVDNCQHVTLRCCTCLDAFLRRIGAADNIRYHDTLRFLDPQGLVSVLRGSPLPAPFHTLPSFVGFRGLRLADKLCIARALLAILLARPTQELDALSMADWLAGQRQTPRALERFWRTILVSACNEELERISCLHGFKIFRDGFLVHPRAFHMGLPTVSLGSLYTEPAVQYLEARGAHVRFRDHVDRVCMDHGSVSGVRLADGTRLQAGTYVSAVPFDLFLKLLPAEVVEAHACFRDLRRLEHSPITGVHLWFQGHLPVDEAVALFDREMQWIFRKDFGVEPDAEATCLGLVVSSSRRLVDLPREEIIRIAEAEVRQAIPAARQARLLKARVVKERKATFSPVPGAEKWRPAQRTPIPNLFLAGDWTATGWPATMEGAVRSGLLAAEAVLESLGAPTRLLEPDLPPAGLARFLCAAT